MHRTSAGVAHTWGDSAPKADSPFGIFPPNPALAGKTCRWAFPVKHINEESIMICPSCKKETPDNSRFCLNCGNSIVNDSAKPVVHNYEYEDFSYKMDVTYKEIGTLRIKEIPDDLWREYQDKILPEIRKWMDEGWEPISEVGPAGFKMYEKELGCLTLIFDTTRYSAQRNVTVHNYIVKMRRKSE